MQVYWISLVLRGEKVSVGEPFFDMAFTPFMIVLAMLLPIGGALPWKRAKLGAAMRPLWGVLALSIAMGALLWSLSTGGRMMGAIGLVLALWVVLGTLTELAVRAKLGKAPLGTSLRRLAGLPRADYGKAVAHIGFGAMIFGVSMVTAFEREDIRVVNPGDQFELGGYSFRFDGAERFLGPNYAGERGMVVAMRGGTVVAELMPEKRVYPVQQMPTTEAAINSTITRDLYVALGERQDTGGWAMRTYVKPFVGWLISLADRRFRIGVGLRKMPAGAVPAE